jgi:hypothetical protein
LAYKYFFKRQCQNRGVKTHRHPAGAAKGTLAIRMISYAKQRTFGAVAGLALRLDAKSIYA